MLHPLTSGEKNHLSFRSQHRRRDGSTYDIDIYLQLAIYQTQTVFVAIALDISERLAAERLVAEQQEQMNSALEKLVEIRTEELHRAQTELVRSENFSTLGKVSGGIAHEIRNPLNAVKTSAYFLLNAADPSPEKVREHLERIDRQVTLIDNVITALADIAKLPQARLRPVNLPPSIQFQFDLPEALPEVLADEHQIAIAFRNLVRNARDAMPSGGSLRIQAAIGENTVDFAVIDTGEGIAPENLQRILEPLFTTKVHGMGLGLSITQTIIEKNLGTLSVSSQLGEGSQFQVTLNIAKADG
jgi:two-component system sensor kinase FixL